MNKFKIGDKVRIVEAHHGHGFSIGDIVTLTYIVNNGKHYDAISDSSGKSWFVMADEIELLPIVPPTPVASTSQERKNSPVFSGVLQYFPEAMMEISRHSKKGNDKHNPGQPLHWAKEKSTDHADCIARHLIDIGPNWDALDEKTKSYHATALAWRALALLQTVLERKKS